MDVRYTQEALNCFFFFFFFLLSKIIKIIFWRWMVPWIYLGGELDGLREVWEAEELD